MADGEKLYRGACIACHEVGWKRLAADLSAAARAMPICSPPIASSTLRIILDGAETVTTPRAPNSGSMPAYDTKLSDQQIADVTNYIRNSWGNAAPAVTPAQVAAARKPRAGQ